MLPEAMGTPTSNNEYFETTAITNRVGEVNYPFFWSITTHETVCDPGTSAAYVAFTRAVRVTKMPRGRGWTHTILELNGLIPRWAIPMIIPKGSVLRTMP